jgi:hypothetical protein
MTAITEAPESLDWVRFSDEENESCEAVSRDCPLEAVAVAVYSTECDCAVNPQRLCAGHRDLTLARAGKSRGRLSCNACGSTMHLLRIEPIR